MNFEDNMKTKENHLYLAKCLACICVVFIHCPFPTRIGTAIDAVCRFAVPFFFMVSGYFLLPPNGTSDISAFRKAILRRARKNGLLFLVAFILCEVVLDIWKGSVDWDRFSIPNILILFLLNQGPVLDNQYHLWYLLATVCAYAAFYIAPKFFADHRKKLVVVWGILFVTVDWMTRGKSFLFCGNQYSGQFFLLNGWVAGIFFFLLGMNIRDSIVQRDLMYQTAKKLVGGCRQYLVVVTLYAVAVLERMLAVGKNLSAYVYLVHLPLVKLLVFESKAAGFGKPILVVFLSVLLALGIAWVKSNRYLRFSKK